MRREIRRAHTENRREALPIVLTVPHPTFRDKESTVRSINQRGEEREKPEVRRRRRSKSRDKCRGPVRRRKSHFALDLQKPCSEDSASVTKTNRAAGTDGDRGAEDPPERLERVVAVWSEWCVGIAGLRCWLHPNMYVFIIPRLMDRQKESERG